MKKLLTLQIILLLTLAFSPSFLGELNAIRLQPLRVNDALQEIAQGRSEDMAERGYFSHYTPEGTMVFSEMARRGFVGWNGAECLARGYNSPPEALRAFLGSVAHKGVLLASYYTDIGIGVAVDSDGVKYMTILLAGRR